MSKRSQKETSVPAMMAPPPTRDRPWTRSLAGMIGLGFLSLMILMCVATLPWTLGWWSETYPPGLTEQQAHAQNIASTPRYAQQDPLARNIPPTWWPMPDAQDASAIDNPAVRIENIAARNALAREAVVRGISIDQLAQQQPALTPRQLDAVEPIYVMGTDVLGRDVFWRVLAGGGISLTIGLAAALISVFLGTLYGALSGYAGGKTDAVMMRIVDILFGLPYILLVVLFAVAISAAVDNWQAKAAQKTAAQRSEYVQNQLETIPEDQHDDPEVIADLEAQAKVEHPSRELSDTGRQWIDVMTLLVAIGAVSWLTMARVVRGQVLSLKSQPFMEAARAMGVPVHGQFVRHLLPNLLGPIIVYATLTVPQAILQESFLSFLGIGVRPPLPSWGNLAAEGLVEINPYQSRWWLLFFPCLMLGTTLLALNFVGEGLREAFDPKRTRR